MAKKQIDQGSSYEAVLKKATKEKVSYYSFSKIYPALITLIITLSVSIGLWRLVATQVENDNNTSFDKALTSIMTRFEGEYQKNYQVLTSVRGLYDNLVQVVRDYFELYASIPTKTLGSLIGVIYSPRVYNKEIDDFYYNIRSQGLWDYLIYPDVVKKTYYPIQFIVPWEKNQQWSGYDLSTESLIKEAIIKALENNEVVATPIFKVRPDTLGFYLISPIYRKNKPLKTKEDRIKYYDGSVILLINANLFFKNSLGTGNQSDTSVIFQCYNTGQKKNVVFQSKNYKLSKTDYKPELTEERTLIIADKKFPVKYQTIPDFGGSFQQIAPILTLVVSLILSLLASAFIVNVINRKQSALSLAERMTRSQRRIVESSNDIIAVLDLDGIWKSMNPASSKILQYQPDELVNQKIDKLFVDGNEKAKFFHIVESPSDNLTQKIDVKMLSKSGETKWISWSLSVSRIEGMVYTTGRDVTLEKIAEGQEKIRNKQVMLAEQLSREASEYKSSFFAKLSLQLRNSLTGILGYLDLISFKAYETDEEHDSYIEEATKSSREILSFVMDTSDTWGISDSGRDEEDSLRVMTPIKVEKPINKAVEEFNKKHKIIFNVDKSVSENLAVMDMNLLAKTLINVFDIFIENQTKPEINISARKLTDEEMTEIIISSPKIAQLTEMIEVFNREQNNLIDSLKKDKNDILLRLALTASNFRMLNGKMALNSDENSIKLSVKITYTLQQEKSVA